MTQHANSAVLREANVALQTLGHLVPTLDKGQAEALMGAIDSFSAGDFYSHLLGNHPDLAERYAQTSEAVHGVRPGTAVPAPAAPSP